jgi:hypothetical protein
VIALPLHLKSNTRLLLGYLFSNGNGTWSIERTGKSFRQVYASIDEAAKGSSKVCIVGACHVVTTLLLAKQGNVSCV